MLARIGFPGIGLWLLLWLTWACTCSAGSGVGPGACWTRPRPPSPGSCPPSPAFLIGAYFDPSLEGPHVAIWLFTVVGLGIAATRVRRPVAMVPAWRGPPAAAPRRPRRLHPSPGAAGAALAPGPARLGRGRPGALGTLTGVTVGVYVARWFGATEFGAFSIAFATYLLLFAAFAGWPPMRWPSATRRGRRMTWRRTVASATGTAASPAWPPGPPVRRPAAPLPDRRVRPCSGWDRPPGPAAPGQLAVRLPAAAARPGRHSSTTWCGRGPGGRVATLAVTGRNNVGWVMLAWGGPAIFAAAVGAVQARLCRGSPGGRVAGRRS